MMRARSSSSASGPPVRDELVRDQLEADRARALDQYGVAPLDHRLGERDRSLGVRRPGVRRVGAGELANPEDRLDAKLARVGADLAVVAVGVWPELAHLPQDGHVAS